MAGAILYVAMPDAPLARRVAQDLVAKRLAACVNVFVGMESFYLWQGEAVRGREAAMLVKTTAACQEAAIAAIRAAHPDEEPAILAFAPSGGSASFLAWIEANTQPDAITRP